MAKWFAENWLILCLGMMVLAMAIVTVPDKSKER
jgi:hypothetical protein